MELKALIFSNQIKHRILRHIVFWIGRFCISMVDFVGLYVDQDVGFKKLILWDFFTTIMIIGPQIPFCYFILYFLIPTFILRKKYVVGITILIASILISYWMTEAYFQWVYPKFCVFFGIHSTIWVREMGFVATFATSGSLVACSLMCSLKFLKIWYVKRQQNIELVLENSKAELQLLKAQIHPHFLFNTLNNIYAFTITKSPTAADLIDKLFGIFHYMVNEGQNTFVPLRKEIKLIQDYISLEKVRYGDRLNIVVNITGKVDNQSIAPLLMITFVENSFKHGSSKMLEHPTINLSITIEQTQLIFILKNDKPRANTQNNSLNDKGGIGLKNVSKRLQLLYPDNHHLKIEMTDTTFSVHMRITLKETIEVNTDNSQLLATQQTLSYASP